MEFLTILYTIIYYSLKIAVILMEMTLLEGL